MLSFRRRLREGFARGRGSQTAPSHSKPQNPTANPACEIGPLVVTLSPNSHYLIQAHSPPVAALGEVQLGAPLPVTEFGPATVVHYSTPPSLAAKLHRFCADPDFDKEFLNAIVLISPKRAGIVDKKLRCVLAQELSHVKSIYVIQQTVPEGPYFARGQRLLRTWRLYPDIYEAFHLPTIHGPGSDQFTGITIMHDGHLMVPVPSRLHYPRSTEKPLNGVRITVKDIIDLAGIKTSGQSRSYEKLYGPRSETAWVIRSLLSLGAVVVGKTKGTQFASSDQPTADWIDFHCPWNPRGDGYLSPRGSSTGTCVALAGYSWCDAGIAGGSIRGPAAVMGLYALRPTHSLKLLHGILPIHRDLDTPGLVCRDPQLFHDLSQHMFGPEIQGSSDAKPTVLLYPEDYWCLWRESPAWDVLEAAVQRLEEYLGVQRTKATLAERWRHAKPSEPSIADYLQNTFMTLLLQGYYVNFSDFRKEYEEIFGVPPYVHPVIQDCWERGERITPQELAQAREHKSKYARWLASSCLGSGFKVVMVYPVGDFEPFYRDVYKPHPKDRSQGYDWNQREDHQASLAGVPSVIVPVGQVAQPSRITGKTQELPVAISLMSAAEVKPGTHAF
ncbi:hypothetical protein OQA88_7715 [Cercophora sp. LCS_1]